MLSAVNTVASPRIAWISDLIHSKSSRHGSELGSTYTEFLSTIAPSSWSRRHVFTRRLVGRGGSWCTSRSQAGRASRCDICVTIYVTTVTLSSDAIAAASYLIASAHDLLDRSCDAGPGRPLGPFGRSSRLYRFLRRAAAGESLRRPDRARPHRRRHWQPVVRRGRRPRRPLRAVR